MTSRCRLALVVSATLALFSPLAPHGTGVLGAQVFERAAGSDLPALSRDIAARALAGVPATDSVRTRAARIILSSIELQHQLDMSKPQWLDLQARILDQRDSALVVLGRTAEERALIARNIRGIRRR